jgi:hypothetical protein
LTIPLNLNRKQHHATHLPNFHLCGCGHISSGSLCPAAAVSVSARGASVSVARAALLLCELPRPSARSCSYPGAQACGTGVKPVPDKPAAPAYQPRPGTTSHAASDSSSPATNMMAGYMVGSAVSPGVKPECTPEREKARQCERNKEGKK